VFATESERLFAEYLGSQGYQWSYEPTNSGKSRKPDFLVQHGECKHWFDVKERSQKPQPDGACQFDPYKVWRKPIDRAREKFTEYKDDCCSLVCYNCGDLDMVPTPPIIFASMLGDLGFTWALDLEGDTPQPAEKTIFLPRRGKMVNYPRRIYSNQTISSVIVLRVESLRNPDFEALISAELQRMSTLSASEEGMWLDHLPAIERISRVVVCENPGARIPLPRDLFRGAFDERWAIQDGMLKQIFRGSKCDCLSREKSDLCTIGVCE